jgi:processive 1,2-diacylglycerol beta-glucosyltransferase
MNRLGMRRLARAIEADRPDLILSVHPTPAGALSELKRRGFSCPPHATVFTDFVVHTQWIYHNVDWYCVPTEEIRIGLERRGIPRDRVLVSGIPIAPEFSARRHVPRSRNVLQLDHEPFTVLLMSGAYGGLGRLGSAIGALRALTPPLQITVVCGTDGALAERLCERWRGQSGIRVLGYVQAIHLEMAAAHLLITKAGAVTLAEAFTVGLPVVCYGSLPGQEARNQRAIEISGAALVARTPSALRETVELLRSDPRLLHKLKSNAAGLGHPDAAQTVARHLLTAAHGRAAIHP